MSKRSQGLGLILGVVAVSILLGVTYASKEVSELDYNIIRHQINFKCPDTEKDVKRFLANDDIIDEVEMSMYEEICDQEEVDKSKERLIDYMN